MMVNSWNFANVPFFSLLVYLVFLPYLLSGGQYFLFVCWIQFFSVYSPHLVMCQVIVQLWCFLMLNLFDVVNVIVGILSSSFVVWLLSFSSDCSESLHLDPTVTTSKHNTQQSNYTTMRRHWEIHSNNIKHCSYANTRAVKKKSKMCHLPPEMWNVFPGLLSNA